MAEVELDEQSAASLLSSTASSRGKVMSSFLGVVAGGVAGVAASDLDPGFVPGDTSLS